MPIYEYECEQCGEKQELIKHVGDDRLPLCECGEFMQRIISAPAQPVMAMPLSSNSGSLAEWNKNRRESLMKRSLQHSLTPKAKEEARANIERQVKLGNAPAAILNAKI